MVIINLSIQSYTDAGTLKPDRNYGYKKRLLIQWQLTETVGDDDEVFFIEEKKGFNERPNPYETLKKTKVLSKEEKSLLERTVLFNKGQLCPPNCPDD